MGQIFIVFSFIRPVFNGNFRRRLMPSEAFLRPRFEQSFCSDLGLGLEIYLKRELSLAGKVKPKLAQLSTEEGI